MEFAEKIHQQRKKLGLTMEEVGHLVGVSKATIQRYESGDIRNVRHEKIAKLAAALQVTPAYLMGWEENEGKGGEADDINLLYTRPELRTLLALAKDSSKEEVEQLTRMIEAFRKNSK